MKHVQENKVASMHTPKKRRTVPCREGQVPIPVQQLRRHDKASSIAAFKLAAVDAATHRGAPAHFSAMLAKKRGDVTTTAPAAAELNEAVFSADCPAWEELTAVNAVTQSLRKRPAASTSDRLQHSGVTSLATWHVYTTGLACCAPVSLESTTVEASAVQEADRALLPA